MRCERKWIEFGEMIARHGCDQEAEFECRADGGKAIHLCTHHAAKWRMWRRRKNQCFSQHKVFTTTNPPIYFHIEYADRAMEFEKYAERLRMQIAVVFGINPMELERRIGKTHWQRFKTKVSQIINKIKGVKQ